MARPAVMVLVAAALSGAALFVDAGIVRAQSRPLARDPAPTAVTSAGASTGTSTGTSARASTGTSAGASTGVSAGAPIERALRAYRSGRHVEAVALASDALASAREDAALRTRALTLRALAQHALGRSPDAVADLQAATASGEDPCPGQADPLLLDAVATVQLSIGHSDAARRCIDRALAGSRDELARAVLLNNRGRLLEAQEQFDEAAASYEEAAQLAGKRAAPLVAAKALVNRAGLAALHPGSGELPAHWPRALAAARALPAARERGLLQASLGDAVAASLRTQPPSRALAADARAACTDAGRDAADASDRRLAIHAQLCLADLAEAEGRPQVALGHARAALGASSMLPTGELVFASRSRIARLLRDTGRRDQAIDAYRESIAALASIRGDLAATRNGRRDGFRIAIEPVYTGLADLLLQRASAVPADAQALLREARDVIEGLKAAELRDYFQDDCVDALQARRGRAELADARTAVLYPMFLPGRSVLLVGYPDGTIEQRVLAADRATLAREARTLREAIHQPDTGSAHLAPARRLYDLLLRDLEPALARRNIDTLAIVPDGPLRWVPLAALHDGERHLVARYAIATIPGLELIDARGFGRSDASPLIAGLTVQVGDYAALTAVPAEIEGVRRVFGGRVLRDRDFTAAALAQALGARPHSVVHLASHGEFAGDASRSFLVTADGELSMARLQSLMRLGQYRDTPIELLTLSACETAAGDERAALGLAGLAMQAGARSALATMWRVHDDTTALLIGEFYRALAQAGTSKAQALRRAQLRVLEQAPERERHPYYWSPFLLVGNWL